MNNHYEVTDLFDAGVAAEVVRDDKGVLLDEVSGMVGPPRDVEDE